MNQAIISVTNSEWSAVIPAEQWKVYLEAIRSIQSTRARFVLGGAFGLAGYTGRWRNTKDLDLFVMPSQKDKIIDALTKAGFDDYFSKASYDRRWIYRATKEEMIVDTIWQTPNGRTRVDEEWFKRGKMVTLRGERVAVLPAEELLAIKLYVIQRDRCDWPDLLNLLHATCDQLQWEHVLSRLGPERPLLGALLQVFNWLSPERAARLPEAIRREFSLGDAASQDLARPEPYRVALLDSRPWFAAFQPKDQPMTV
jgi:hypothetical protein